MNRFSVLAFALLVACGGPPPAPKPTSTPEGKLCGRAYGSTIDSLGKVYKKAGLTLPDTLPTREVYVDKCLELGFTEDQARCLDPKLSEADPAGCKTQLDAVKDKKEQLDQLFKDAFDKAAEAEKKKAEEAAAAEGAEGEAAPAEGDAAAEPAAE